MHPFAFGGPQHGGCRSREQELWYQRRLLEEEIHVIEERQRKAQRHHRRQTILKQAEQVQALLNQVQNDRVSASATRIRSPAPVFRKDESNPVEWMMMKLLQQNEELHAMIKQQFSNQSPKRIDLTRASPAPLDQHPQLTSHATNEVATDAKSIDDVNGDTSMSSRTAPQEQAPTPPPQAWSSVEELPEVDWTDADDELFEQLLHGGTDKNDGHPIEIAGKSGADGASTDNDVTAILERKRQQQDRQESRRKLAQLYDTSSIAKGSGIRRPRWRIKEDIANGVVRPFGEDVEDATDELPMQARQVFRSAVIAVMTVLELQRLLHVKRLRLRDKSMQDVEPMLNVYFDATRVWLGKLVKTPLLSIVEDPTLDIDVSIRFGLFRATKGLAKWFGKSRATAPMTMPGDAAVTIADHARIVKLKVRVKGIVDAISKAIEKGDVPSGILDFWKRLTLDGVYFPPMYSLIASERQALDLDALGATRNVQGDYLGCPRFQIIVVNFVLLRILIPHVILRPWELGIGSTPAPKTVAINLKNVATLLYVVIARLSPLPAISTDNEPNAHLGLRRRSVEILPVTEAEVLSSATTSQGIRAGDVDAGGQRFLPVSQIHAQLIPDKQFPSNPFEAFINEQQVRLRQVLLDLQGKLHPRESTAMQ